MTPQQRFRIDWVLVDELAIGPAPRAERHLPRLAAAGVRAVLSLCSEQEAPLPLDSAIAFRSPDWCCLITVPDDCPNLPNSTLPWRCWPNSIKSTAPCLCTVLEPWSDPLWCASLGWFNAIASPMSKLSTT